MSRNPSKILVIVFCVLIFILSETRLTTEALTDAQRKEIESLRAELEDAFDKDEERIMREHGVIVQPSWTQDHKSNHKLTSKVVVTNQGIKEAKTLRDEITKAIKQDNYSPLVGRGHIGADTHIVQELHKHYVTNSNNQKNTDVTLVGAENPDASSGGPNVVETSNSNLEPDIDIRKLQRLELNKRRTKEALVLESIEEDFSFTQGEHVLEWEHIMHGGHEYFIGRLEQDLQIVHKNAVTYEPGTVLRIGAPITYLETYSFWNVDKQQQEGIILVATGNKVLWYRADEKSGQVEVYWEWVVGKAITGLTYFTADAQDYLVISSNQSSRAGYYALNIYQFDLKNKEFWIAQRMQLTHPCNEVTFLDTGRDFILAVPQNNTAKVYAFNPHTEASGHVRFQQKFSFESEGIEYINAFQMGGRSYLALGGLQPQILLYQQGKFVPRTIFGNNFGLVEFFFPIPVRTYRDDLILLVQHRVDFDTHKLTVLETLIWDGEAFEATIPAPCKLGSHTVHGVGCMLDLHRDAGLKGAALLRRGDEVSVIVPRHKAESGLFRLHTKLLSKNSELKDLQEIFDFLKQWVAEQDKFVEQAEEFLSDSKQQTSEPDWRNLQTLKTPELFFDGTVKQLYVNDYKWTQQDSMTDLNDLMDEIEKLGNELGAGVNKRHRREAADVEYDGHNAEFESLELENIFAESLQLENLNDEQFFIKHGHLEFEGILNLVDLEVLETEVVSQNTDLIFDELNLDHNLEFEQINGVDWSEIAQNVVFRNKPIDFENLNFKGEIIVEDLLHVEHLNSLKFPDDFLWSEGVDNQIISAPKTFTGTLAANHVDSDGLINGKNPLEIVTLSDPQDWSGSPNFAHLEVSEVLELNGTARGRGVDEFPLNPTLEESNIINANCEFANLKVLGSIKVQENLNDKPLTAFLNNIVQRLDDATEETLIASPKTFAEVYFPIDFHVHDGAISNISVDEFIPQHTTQHLNISELNGNSFFKNLTINGTYDGVDLNELLNNSINIMKPQFLPKTQLNFVNAVKANQINISKTLNGVPIATGLQTIHEDLQMPAAHFETLSVKEATVQGTTQGNGILNGLKNISESSTASPIEIANIFVDELILGQDLKVDEIQGIDAKVLYKFLETVDDLPEMILDGKVHIDHVVVTGNVQVNKLNGQNFDEDVQMTAIWLNRPNYLSTSLQFSEPVDLQSDLVVLGDFNGENLPDLIDDMVFRVPNGTILILAPKNFVNSINVARNTKIDALNGISFEHIATKRNLARFKGHLKVDGELNVQDLHVNGSLNDFFMSNITDRLYYDNNLRAFVLHGVTDFYSPLMLNDLTVLGDLNEFAQLENFFSNLAYKQLVNRLNGLYNFTGRVSIKRGMFVDQLNGHRLLDLFNNVVYINSLESIIINSPINFAAPVKASTLNVHGALQTNNVSGCNVSDWLSETLRLDRPENITALHFAPNSLNINGFYVKYLNNIDLTKIITLYTPQNFTAGMEFSEIFLDGGIFTADLVNGADLPYEFENTVFINGGEQYITTPLTIQTVNVLENMETRAPINGDKNLKDVALIYEDVEFESPFYFEQLQVNNLATSDQISGIDFDKWYEDALWFRGRPSQYITGNWSVHELSLEMGPKMVSQNVGHIRSVRGLRYNDLCRQVKQLWLKFNKKFYFLRHLEKAFEVDLNKKAEKDPAQIVKTLFVLRHEQQNYLLVNLGCTSLILKWQPDKSSFKILDTFNTGYVRQAFSVTAEKSGNIIFVTNGLDDQGMKCANTGLALWIVRDERIELSKSFGIKAQQVWPTVNRQAFFALTFEGLKTISASEPYAASSLEIDNPFELLNYSFVGFGAATEMFFNNGMHLIEISQTNATQTERRRRSMPVRFSLYRHSPRFVHKLVARDESVLKPDETLLRNISFADFSQVIEHILEDLDYRLSIEVNITQLSIPETDLYDAHLAPDFLAIMEELRSQNIYAPNMFDEIDLSNLKISENPVQVLAARTVQIVWPVIVEINEVHRYLQGNTSSPHPTSGCILNYLGTAIREILLLAKADNEQQNNSTVDQTTTLAAVIQRIRQFQTGLKALKTELQIEISENLNTAIEKDSESFVEGLRSTMEDSKESAETINGQVKGWRQNLAVNILQKSNQANKSVSAEHNEILKLEVGPATEPRILIATTNLKTQLTPGQPAGINVYTDLRQNELFQFIPAHKAHLLSSLRIRDMTFLAYVEHCCLVNVLQYRGIEGFVEFAKFSTDVLIQQLATISLPKAESKLGNYLVVALKRKIVFYEFVFAGLRGSVLEGLQDC